MFDYTLAASKFFRTIDKYVSKTIYIASLNNIQIKFSYYHVYILHRDFIEF